MPIGHPDGNAEYQLQQEFRAQERGDWNETHADTVT